MNAIIFETVSQQWVRLDSEGDAFFTQDKNQASVIESTQLEAYIRNYELDFVRNSLELEAVDGGPLTPAGSA